MNRKALLVLGVHRSGTSALTGCLIQLGAQGPKTLMPPHADNPAGYWESNVLHELHERLLGLAASTWYGWAPLDRAWFESATAAAVAAECRASIHAEFDSAPLFVVKDPRICRFVPFWVNVLTSLHIAAAPILVIRSPLEVARSLRARDGFGIDRCLLIWLRHVLDAEAGTRTLRRSMVRYDEVLEDWRVAARRIASDLDVTWPNASALEDPMAQSEVRLELRHHHAGIESLTGTPRLVEWIRETWQALGLLLQPGGSQSREAAVILDCVKKEFDAVTSIFGPAVRDETIGMADRMARAESECVRLRDVLTRVQREPLPSLAQQEQLRAELGSLRTEIGAVRADLDTVRIERDVTRVEGDHLRREVAVARMAHDSLRTELVSAQAIVTQLREETDAASSRVSEVQRELGDAKGASVSLTTELTTARQRVASLLGSGSWRITAPLRAVFRLLTGRES